MSVIIDMHCLILLYIFNEWSIISTSGFYLIIEEIINLRKTERPPFLITNVLTFLIDHFTYIKNQSVFRDNVFTLPCVVFEDTDWNLAKLTCPDVIFVADCGIRVRSP